MLSDLTRAVVVAAFIAIGLAVVAVPLCAASRCMPPPPIDPVIPGTDAAQRPATGSTAPIVIATDRRLDYRMTSADDGVLFDIDGDGVREQVAWTAVSSRVAFLVLDRDGDGAITSGREMFSDDTRPDSPNGFDALIRTSLESSGANARGSIGRGDPLFAQLQLWTDVNHNGVSEPAELRPASELLSDIGLVYHRYHRSDRFGNVYRFAGWARTRSAPGSNDVVTAGQDERRRIEIFDVSLAAAPAAP